MKAKQQEPRSSLELSATFFNLGVEARRAATEGRGEEWEQMLEYMQGFSDVEESDLASPALAITLATGLYYLMDQIAQSRVIIHSALDDIMEVNGLHIEDGRSLAIAALHILAELEIGEDNPQDARDAAVFLLDIINVDADKEDTHAAFVHLQLARFHLALDGAKTARKHVEHAHGVLYNHLSFEGQLDILNVQATVYKELGHPRLLQRVETQIERVTIQQKELQESLFAPQKEALVADLDALIGLSGVKTQIHGLFNLARVQQRRIEMGLPVNTSAQHLVFTGPPGTGKTTVARLLGQAYHLAGRLPTNRVIEVSRADVVGQYVGETAPKVKALLRSARGGVLFIDEAYELQGRGHQDYGHEALATLLKEMEDMRDDLVVVLAGYPKEMEQMLDSNTGLRSRFTTHIDFPAYTPQELADIFFALADQQAYTLSDEARAAVVKRCAVLKARSSERFGNGRAMRTLFEQSLARHANRIATDDSTLADETALSRILMEDIAVDDTQLAKSVGFL